MALTKPAGCAVQLIGAPFVIGGFALLFSQPVLGVPIMAVGVLLLALGRRTG